LCFFNGSLDGIVDQCDIGIAAIGSITSKGGLGQAVVLEALASGAADA
jgi:hypothetical protein